MKKILFSLGVFTFLMVLGNHAFASTIPEKSIEESYRDAINGVTDIPLDNFNTSDLTITTNSGEKDIQSKKYETAQILEENNDEQLIAVTVFHDLYINNKLQGDKGDSKWDDSSGVQAYSRVYYKTKTEGNRPYGKLTKATGGWNVADPSISLTNRIVRYGTIGWPAGDSQSVTKYPSNNSFNYNAPSNWQYVNMNAMYQIGVNSTVTLKKGSSSWTLYLDNYL